MITAEEAKLKISKEAHERALHDAYDLIGCTICIEEMLLDVDVRVRNALKEERSDVYMDVDIPWKYSENDSHIAAHMVSKLISLGYMVDYVEVRSYHKEMQPSDLVLHLIW